MKNRTVNGELTKRFSEIRAAIERMQENVDGIIYKAASQNAENVKRFNENYGAEVRAALVAKASDGILKAQQTAKSATDKAFTAIRMSLRDWTLEPISATTAAALETYTKNNIMPSRREFQILDETVSGSYLGGRILCELAKSSGFAVSDFQTIDQIEKSLKAAQSAVNLAIANYSGKAGEDHRYVSDLLGIDVSTDSWYKPFAEDILTSDNEFTRCESTLTAVTETDVALLPTKRAEIDKMFDGVEEADRIKIVQDVISSADYVMADCLRLYDSKLYEQAETSLAEYRREALREAIEQRNTATLAASQALADVKALEAPQAAV